MEASITILFKDIFPTYETFKEFTDNLEITDDMFNRKCYRYLFYKFYNQNINYDLEDNFKRAFALVYMNVFEKYKKQYELISQLYKLELDKLIERGEVISNMAGNPPESPTDPTKPLNYVVNQNYTLQKEKGLDAYLDTINKLPNFEIDKFLDEFKKLFLWIIPCSHYCYY